MMTRVYISRKISMRGHIIIFKVSVLAFKLCAKHGNARKWGKPSIKFLQITCSEIDSGGNFVRKMLFDSLLNTCMKLSKLL